MQTSYVCEETFLRNLNKENYTSLISNVHYRGNIKCNGYFLKSLLPKLDNLYGNILLDLGRIHNRKIVTLLSLFFEAYNISKLSAGMLLRYSGECAQAVVNPWCHTMNDISPHNPPKMLPHSCWYMFVNEVVNVSSSSFAHRKGWFSSNKPNTK